MKQSWLRRLERIEERQAPVAGPEGHYSGPIGNAILICFALREGGNALEEITEAGASIDPERHAELTAQLEGARKVAAALVRYCEPLETGSPLSDLVASVGPLTAQAS